MAGRRAWAASAAGVCMAALALLAAVSANAVVPASCGGAADASFTPHRTITGELSTAQEGSFVYLPFDVPAATTAIRIRYCHDQPELVPPNPLPNAPKHVLDLGLYEARPGPGQIWGPSEFRGWGGSSIRDVTVSPNGFTSDAVYEASPDAHVQGFTTRAYEPGPIPAGEWAVELGVAAVASQQELDLDGKVAFRVEIDVSQSNVWTSNPYSPTPYDATPANPSPGWYQGDFHVHGEQEPGNATMRKSLDYAFGPYGGDGAGLDFVTQVDHNNVVNYSEIGRYQPDYPGKLIIRSTEVTTYRGHLQNHASGQFVDYRTGPLLEASLDDAGGINRTLGSLTQRGNPRPASEILSAVNAAGGFTQINHPTIFPSAIPTFDDFCRGCAWGYSAAETDYSQVDAIEIATGPAGLHVEPNPGPNPFTPLAIRFWEDAIDAGGVNSHKIAAVGSSDSHQALRRADLDPVANVTDAPIGMATTVVFANELSETGIRQGVEAGHTYVKPWGRDGPELRLEATVPGSGAPPAIIGDTVGANQVEFTAAVKNLSAATAARPGAYTLFVVRNGLPFLSTPIPPGQDEFEFSYPSVGPSRYRLQVDRTVTGGASVEAVSSPIYVEPPAGAAAPPSAAITDVSVIEGDSGTRAATFTASISNPAAGPLSLDYATAEGTATAGTDFQSRSGIVTFQPGETSKQVVVPAIGDTLEEPDETFSVTLSNPAGVTIAKAQGAGTILDDEGVKPGPCSQTQTGTDNGEQLTGSELSDRILGNGGDDLIAGGAGPDCLDGGIGDDEVDGEAGRDRVAGGDGNDRLLGGKGRDRVRGGPGRDRIRVVGGGRDVVRCGPGKDRVKPGPNDRLRGCELVK